jgi:hypothetical protein
MFRTNTSKNLSKQKPLIAKVLSYEIMEYDETHIFMDVTPTPSPRSRSEIEHKDDELERQLQAVNFEDTLEPTVPCNSTQSIHGNEMKIQPAPKMSPSQFNAFTAAGEDEKSPGTASTPSSTTIGMTLNTASPTSVHVSTDEDNSFSTKYPFDEEDAFYHSNEFDYFTPHHVMDKLDQDISHVLKGKDAASKEMQQLLEKTGIMEQTQPASMPAAFAADPRSVPLTPNHAELREQHFGNLRYYVKSGLLFTNHDSHRKLLELRQSKPKASTTATSTESLHSHFTFSSSHTNSNN